ncbi:hypothetical protein PR048_023588 [Dryococelus australis]|uniref:Uncharacterized protein n=1 Tax=Dryococelus australis TaxID=614101 RepID=A0ABQ9GUH7_9NEOP|nr:hypothetical protein PR048_023588 [Dryococelus australis]
MTCHLPKAATYQLCDETTDTKGRCVASVNILEEADAMTCSQAINEHSSNCYRLCMCNFNDSNFWITCGHCSVLGPQLALVGHIFCIHLTEVNEAVVNVKTTFLNTQKRKHHYVQYLEEHRSKAPNLFSIPVNTRWNSWFRAVFYLTEYLVDNVNFKLDEIKAINNNEKDMNLVLAQYIFDKTHAADIFSSDSSLTTTEKALVKQKCQKASTLAMTKLQSLMNVLCLFLITFLYSMEWIILFNTRAMNFIKKLLMWSEKKKKKPDVSKITSGFGNRI